MHIENLGKNKTVINFDDTIVLDDSNPESIIAYTGTIALYISYTTPVACRMGDRFYRSSKLWSPTTSKHINQWMNYADSEQMPQEFFDHLLEQSGVTV